MNRIARTRMPAPLTNTAKQSVHFRFAWQWRNAIQFVAGLEQALSIEKIRLQMYFCYNVIVCAVWPLCMCLHGCRWSLLDDEKKIWVASRDWSVFQIITKNFRYYFVEMHFCLLCEYANHPEILLTYLNSPAWSQSKRSLSNEYTDTKNAMQWTKDMFN